MKDDTKRLWQSYGVMALCALALIWAAVGIVYAVVTGNALFTNIHYSTAGRVEQAVLGVAAILYGAWFVRGWQRRRREDDANRRD